MSDFEKAKVVSYIEDNLSFVGSVFALISDVAERFGCSAKLARELVFNSEKLIDRQKRVSHALHLKTKILDF